MNNQLHNSHYNLLNKPSLLLKMVEAKQVRAPKGNDREQTLKPKPPKQDKKTLVNMHHPNTYFFKKYSKTLVPVSRVFLMNSSVSSLDEAMKSWKSAQAMNLKKG